MCTGQALDRRLLMERLPDSSLVIGVATSTAERVRLARLLGGADALLLVSSADQARAFLELAGAAPPAMVLKPDTVTAGLSPALVGQPLDREQPDASLDGLTLEADRRVDSPAGLSRGADTHPSGLQLDLDRWVIRWQDREVPLTRLEQDFLRCLVAEPGEVWTYERLHLAVWGNEHLGHGSHIHSVVKRLRRKLAQVGATVTIQAVRGVGFHLPA
jgi:hypothetical protein